MIKQLKLSDGEIEYIRYLLDLKRSSLKYDGHTILFRFWCINMIPLKPYNLIKDEASN